MLAFYKIGKTAKFPLVFRQQNRLINVASMSNPSGGIIFKVMNTYETIGDSSILKYVLCK